MTVAPETASSTPRRRFAAPAWVIDCAVVCPIVAAIVLVVGQNSWGLLVSAASALTIAIVDVAPWVGTPPAQLAQILTLFLAAILGALPPAAAMGSCEWRWSDKAASFAALLPIWIVVMLAPAGVIYQHARVLDASFLQAHLAANFVALFSAAASAVAVAYAIWVRHHPDDVMRNRILPKRKSRRAGLAETKAERWDVATSAIVLRR